MVLITYYLYYLVCDRFSVLMSSFDCVWVHIYVYVEEGGKTV